MRVVLFLTFLMLSIISLSSCKSTFPKQESEVVAVKKVQKFFGDEFIDVIIESEKVTFLKVVPKFPSDYELQKSKLFFLDNDRLDIRKILLSDSSYVFDLTKRALFIPEYAIEFSGKQIITIFFSPSSEQIEVLIDGKKLKIDVDPVSKEISAIIKKYNT